MSSSTTLSSAGVGVESSAAGFPITYQCDSVIEKNPKTEDVEVSYYYELQFLSSVGAAFALEEFESNLLTLVSTSYGYDTGSVCTNIAEQGIWLVRVSSLPKDEENRLIGKKHKATKQETHAVTQSSFWAMIVLMEVGWTCGEFVVNPCSMESTEWHHGWDQ